MGIETTLRFVAVAGFSNCYDYSQIGLQLSSI